ncbi:ABC transporter permease [Clostridium estertheticum]|uniref:ABC transporter permease subunit n=1 Tax=Clostridium estertheticum TaxID=238834 RepID=UPI001CF49EFF|nr:ABC transporter permease subunit [Clostridium estertheticum]MCB2305499.1 ABC transporter permease [Clostridium estertheticum]MCB2343938.1 ABC transporter permease [Clostridium estertheticum]MCB2348855.1 ABC transporter permease [Clostridium estertheticum]WAG46175.1 ABC transporter permease [Clostridium estertheticum]
MNRIINKALFYKEWIYVKWITLLTIIILLFSKANDVIVALNDKGMIHRQGGENYYWFNNVLYAQNICIFIMVLVVLILAAILFSGEKTSETQGFMASMPFARKEIIFNKWLVGVVSLLISFAVTYIFLSLFYLLNIKGLDTTINPYFDIIKWFFMNTFQYICIFTFMMLIQAVMGNSIVSSIVGGIILMVPLFITLIVQDLIVRYYGYHYKYMIFYKISNWLNICFYNLSQQSLVKTSINNVYSNVFSYYSNYKSKLLVLFLLTCLFLYFAYVAYKRRNIEYNLRLIVFKNLEPVFIGGVAICLGLLAGAIFGRNYLRHFGIWFVIFTIIGYFISKLLLKVLSSRK